MQGAQQGTLIGWALRTGLGETVVRTASRRGLLDRLAALFMVLSVAAIAAYATFKPDYNWDMVAYVATALENRVQDAQELHRETWAQIDAGSSPEQQFKLKQSNPYNLNQWENPADFQSQLSMYRVKVAYVWLLRALEPVAGLVNASILLSVLPSIGFGLIGLWWLWRENALQAAFILVPMLLIADYSRMTTAVTPDMLLALVSAAALYCLWRGRDGLAGVLLFASVFVRPDNIILIFALLIAAVLFSWRWLPMAVTFVASMIAISVVSKYGEHPGWWAHFYFSCVQIQNSMANFHPDFSLVAFAKGYARGVVVSLQNNDWPALLALMTAAWALLNKYGRMQGGRANALAFALAIGTLGKFASFPLPDDRFYFVFISGMALVLAAAWKPRFEAR
ncbi:hypothetical protein [Mesorhizobium australicum]|uniref:Glycosyltransferase RgtA/B/C/D-like domain-containing protein n=1 Tax=Mesorhizobium australicum TaxID=536018 RepID=A0A1X7P949_9HYPH|nr:hypothetical protein [Mesorhizobium australicum]SMH47063.1 hypothetical protein SAMN02982922_3435 [Mesorhizobium australicum]